MRRRSETRRWIRRMTRIRSRSESCKENDFQFCLLPCSETLRPLEWMPTEVNSHRHFLLLHMVLFVSLCYLFLGVGQNCQNGFCSFCCLLHVLAGILSPPVFGCATDNSSCYCLSFVIRPPVVVFLFELNRLKLSFKAYKFDRSINHIANVNPSGLH